MSEPKLLHFHLPKTGGSALRNFFVEHLGEKAVTPPLQGMMLREALLHWHQAAVISGHFIAKQADTIPADRMAITVLRDPIDRFLSEYFYNKFDIDNQLVEVHQRAGTIDTYIDYLSHAPAEAAMVQMEMLYPLGTDAQRHLSLDEKLISAKKAIDHFGLLGIQEEMDDFCSILCAQFRLPSTQARHVNVTSRRIYRDDLTLSQRHAIERVLEPEIELYSHARIRFQQDRRRFITLHCPNGGVADVVPAGDVGGTEKGAIQIEKQPADFGDRRCEISNIEVLGRISGPGQAMTGETVDVFFHIIAHEALDQLSVGIAFKDEHGSVVFGTNSNLLGDTYSVTSGKYLVKFTFLNRLGPGSFYIDGAVTRKSSHYDGCFHWRHSAAKLVVHAYATQHFEGRVLLDMDLRIDGISSDAVWCRKLPEEKNVVARAFGNACKQLTDFRCSLDLMSPIDIADRSSDVLLQIRTANRGSETWRSGGRYPVRLSYRWLSKQGDTLVADGLRSELSSDIVPGGSAVILLHLRTPDEPAEIFLMVSLVQEGVAWFVDRDQANGRILPITVT
jgi:hypothetical protein